MHKMATRYFEHTFTDGTIRGLPRPWGPVMLEIVKEARADGMVVAHRGHSGNEASLDFAYKEDVMLFRLKYE